MMNSALLAVALTTSAHVGPALIGDCLPLPDSLVVRLRDRGIHTATPIQKATLGRAASGESLLIHAETGSGKTLALLLPAVSGGTVTVS